MNTSVSFVTNTNWQAYSGETTMSYLSQMGSPAVQNFASAAVGGGAIQTLAGSAHDHDALNGASQIIPRGPVASQEVIKQLATNGGGFYNANGPHPCDPSVGYRLATSADGD